jgi:peptidoglycan/LPS O-acetylase OafA/YrhL
LNDAVATIGCGTLIILGSANLPEYAALRYRGMHHLGKVSYSFYLLHAVIVLALLRVLPSSTSHAWIGLSAFAAAYGLATVTFRFIEEPAIAAARKLVKRVSSERVSS